MLLAENHGKRCLEVEGHEDYLTSSVFGHLRLVESPEFWSELLGKALSPISHTSVLDYLAERGKVASQPEIRFWRDCGQHGEPDMLARFGRENGRSFVVLIEVKLNSGKSGFGPDDQLAKYLKLLDDRSILRDWEDAWPRALIYLTQSPAANDIRESIAYADTETASERMFGLLWQDVHDAAAMHAHRSFLLQEVEEFLRRRGFERFSGFKRRALPQLKPLMTYSQSFFTHLGLPESFRGNFYKQ